MSYYNYPMPYGYGGFGNYTSNINVGSGFTGIGGIYNYQTIQRQSPEPVKYNFDYSDWLLNYLQHLTFLHDGCLIGPSAVNEYIKRFIGSDHGNHGNHDKQKQKQNKNKKGEYILEIVIQLSDFIKLANTITQNIQTYFNLTTNGPYYIDVKYPDIALLNAGSLDVHNFELVEITFSRTDILDKIILKSLIMINGNQHSGVKGFNIPYGLYSWEHEYLMVYESRCEIAKSILDRFGTIRPLSPSQRLSPDNPNSQKEYFPPGIDITTTDKFKDQHESYLTQLMDNIKSLFSQSKPSEIPRNKTDNTFKIKIKILLPFVLYKENANGFADGWENIKAVMNDESGGGDYLVDIRSNSSQETGLWFAMNYFPDSEGLCANCGIRFSKNEIYVIPKPKSYSGGSGECIDCDSLFGYHQDCLARKWFYECDELPYGIECIRDGGKCEKEVKMWIPEWLFG